MSHKFKLPLVSQHKNSSAPTTSLVVNEEMMRSVGDFFWLGSVFLVSFSSLMLLIG